MLDLLYVLFTFAFFGICIAYVFLCDRIIGPDDRSSEPAEGRRAVEAAGR